MVVRLARLEAAPRTRAWDAVQRALDLVLVAAAAPVWVPLLGILLAVKFACDGRPVLFRHTRLGRGGRRFELVKIKTTPADFVPRPDDWPRGDYPPRTAFGNWLRRADLDELPQFWNVLRGEMSLVGPRPETAYHADRFGMTLPGYRRRLEARPGLTGLAQARGWRGDTSIAERLRCDVEFVEKRGPLLYASVLASTVRLECRCLRRARRA